MFVGHYGVAFGLKRAAPRMSLGTLIFAAQFLDLLWPTLLLLGIERVAIAPGITRVTPLDFESYPISHSLLAVIGWMVLFGAVYWMLRRSVRGAVIGGLAVLSHWLLDYATHRPDLQLYPGAETRYGLGLWNSFAWTLAVELCIFALGLWLYVKSTRARDRIGSIGFWVLVGFLLVMYLGNVFGPPPTSVTAIAWLGQGQWLLVVWGYWIDRHRSARH
jgi:hypothetical protein